jgi:hypothetical protein
MEAVECDVVSQVRRRGKMDVELRRPTVGPGAPANAVRARFMR